MQLTISQTCAIPRAIDPIGHPILRSPPGQMLVVDKVACSGSCCIVWCASRRHLHACMHYWHPPALGSCSGGEQCATSLDKAWRRSIRCLRMEMSSMYGICLTS